MEFVSARPGGLSSVVKNLLVCTLATLAFVAVYNTVVTDEVIPACCAVAIGHNSRFRSVMMHSDRRVPRFGHGFADGRNRSSADDAAAAEQPPDRSRNGGQQNRRRRPGDFAPSLFRRYFLAPPCSLRLFVRSAPEQTLESQIVFCEANRVTPSLPAPPGRR